jgi:hypothetical protein
MTAILILQSAVAYFSGIFLHKKFQGSVLSGSNDHHVGFTDTRWGMVFSRMIFIPRFTKFYPFIQNLLRG